MKFILLNINFLKINVNGSEKMVWYKVVSNYIKSKFKILEVGKDVNFFICFWIYKLIIC